MQRRAFPCRHAGACRAVWLLVFSCAALVLAGRPALAQVGTSRTVPPPSYFFTFSEFYEGEYDKALKDFRAEGRRGIKTATSHWIDSICHNAMAGECYYQMGQLPQALQHYTQALQLYLAYSDWMIRINTASLPPAIQVANPGRTFVPPWGQSTRNARIGQYPDEMLVAQGRLDNSQQIQRGGVVQAPIMLPVNVQEIVRCSTLALRRRRELLGPASPHDRLANDVFAALSRRPGPGNHWTDVWVSVQLGLAAAAVGKLPTAEKELEQSLVAAGEFDHPMTCIALLELGRIALDKGDFQKAAGLFAETSYSAAQYGDIGVLEEAFRYGAIAHMLSNQQGIYPPLEAAMAWARREDYMQLQAALLTLAAENYVAIGEPGRALEIIAQARAVVGRRAMGAGRTGARLSFVNALALNASRKADQGAAMFAQAMKYQSQGSIWLFQLRMADELYTKGEIQPRVAMELYTELLRDPQPVDWGLEPMESLSVLTDPHPLYYENWFAVALERREPERAFEIADRIRRHRFLSTLEMGGRVAGLRWLLEGPKEALDAQTTLERQELLTSFPAYDQLSQQAEAIRVRLKALPVQPVEPEQQRAQATLMGEWGKVSLAQEELLREMALRRKASAILFPPQRTFDEIQNSLPVGTALLSFINTRHGLFGFLISAEKGKYEPWQVAGGAPLVQRRLTPLLRGLGNYEQNSQLDAKTLNDDAWVDQGRELLTALTKGSKTALPGAFQELVVVPDGALWYLPFESLPGTSREDTEPMITRTRVRYAPTAGLAVPDARPRAQGGATAVVAGRLFPHDAPEVGLAAAEQIGKLLPGAVTLATLPPGPSVVYRTLFNRLIVLADIPAADQDPYAWSPMALEKGNANGSLGMWFGLPWGSPDQVLLPGFHTAAERALNKVNGNGAGMEVFLSVCGLMSTGSRTILLSRWRTGGQTCIDLLQEFAQELPHDSAAAAWQRSVLLTRDATLDLEREPRVKKTSAEQAWKAAHPFFWAGYLLVDPGLGAADQAPPLAPQANAK